MTDVQALLSLPVETIATLGSGYLGYRLAYVGQNQQHRAIDVAFISLAFGLIYRIPGLFEPVGDGYLWVQILAGTTSALLCAVIWRVWLRQWVMKLLRDTGISISDGSRSAWDSIRVSTKARPTQLVVRQKDGPTLMCDYLHSFESLPHGPCILGEDGSIALYVTHIKQPGEADWVLATWTETSLGSQITYIPASQITSIEMRDLTT
jgi:hypothetical protein